MAKYVCVGMAMLGFAWGLLQMYQITLYSAHFTSLPPTHNTQHTTAVGPSDNGPNYGSQFCVKDLARKPGTPSLEESSSAAATEAYFRGRSSGLNSIVCVKSCFLLLKIPHTGDTESLDQCG